MRATLAVVATAGLVLLAACGSGSDLSAGADSSSTPQGASSTAQGASPAVAAAYTDITPEELAEMLDDKDFVLVNTHVPYEGEIEQTDLFLPFDRAAELIDRLPTDTSARIVVYCRSDRMSRIAAEMWAEAGYTELYNLDGGFVAWEAAGYPLLHLDREQ